MFNLDNETLFSIVGIISFIGWGALLISPLQREKMVLFARVITIVLALFYVGKTLSLLGTQPEINFGTLEGVSNGFGHLGHLLAGWIHFLAFDLFIGAWEVERAQKIGIPHILLIPCLLLTFMFGPVGLLLFIAVQSIKLRKFSVT